MNMKVITQVSKIQYRKGDGKYFVYLWKEYERIWRELKKKRVSVVVRIEVPDEALK